MFREDMAPWLTAGKGDFAGWPYITSLGGGRDSLRVEGRPIGGALALQATWGIFAGSE